MKHSKPHNPGSAQSGDRGYNLDTREPGNPALEMPAISASQGKIRYTWPRIWGFFLVICALYSLVTGALSLINRPAGPETFSAAKAIGSSLSAIVQGMLWAITGIAIIRHSKRAYNLVLIVVCISGLGALVRGLIPWDILLWLATFGFAGRQGGFGITA